MSQSDSTEVPGTDREEAREHAQQDDVLRPDGVGPAEDDPAQAADGASGDEAKPTEGTTPQIR